QLLQYQDVWDASTNTPALADGGGTLNHWYRVNVAGTTDFGNGPITFAVGDKVVYGANDRWNKWDTNDEVTSVAGKTGDVVLDNTDVGLGNVTNDAQLKRSNNDFSTFLEKADPVDDDIVLIEDSEDTFNKKKVRLENLLGGGSGGGSFAWEMNGDIAPIELVEHGMSLYGFDHQSLAEIYALVVVPDSYKPGKQIKLLNAAFSSPGNADNVYFRSLTTLVKTGVALPSANTHTSDNAELTLVTANVVTPIGALNLTGAVGEINAVAVAPGDILIVKFYWDIVNASVSNAELAKFLKYSASISFQG